MATHITDPVTNKTWVQVVDQAEALASDETRTLTMSYKGETQRIANAAKNINVGDSLSVVNGYLTTQFGSIDDAGMSISWAPPLSMEWRVAGYDIRQFEAGQYSLLKVTYEADVAGGSSEYTTLKEDSVSLQWQTYSVSPYRYCNEKEHEDLLIDTATGEAGQETAEQAKSSVRRHIEMAFTQNAQNSESNPYRWEQQNTTRELTSAEKLIMNKVAAGVNPVFHYPIVQHTRVYEANHEIGNEVTPDIVSAIDVITTLPNSVSKKITKALLPWTALSGSFIYCGQTVGYTTRDVQDQSGTTKIYTYTFVDTYEGALDPDKNFYNVPGASAPNDRWKFGVGPQPSPGGGGNNN